MSKKPCVLSEEVESFLAVAHAALVVMGMGYKPDEGDSTPYESLAKRTLGEFLEMCRQNNIRVHVSFRDRLRIQEKL